MTHDPKSPSLNSHAILPVGFHGHLQKYEGPRLSDIVFPILELISRFLKLKIPPFIKCQKFCYIPLL